MTFNEWWRDIGSGIIPGDADDTEEHSKMVACAAWAAATALIAEDNNLLKHALRISADHIEAHYRADMHSQLTARERWPGMFARIDSALKRKP